MTELKFIINKEFLAQNHLITKLETIVNNHNYDSDLLYRLADLKRKNQSQMDMLNKSDSLMIYETVLNISYHNKTKLTELQLQIADDYDLDVKEVML